MDKKEDVKRLSMHQSNILNCICDLVWPPLFSVFMLKPQVFLGQVWLFRLPLTDSYQTINISGVYLPRLAALYTRTPQSQTFF